MNNDSELIDRLFADAHPTRLEAFIYLAKSPSKTFSLVDLENTLQGTIYLKYGKHRGAIPYIFPNVEVLWKKSLVEKKFKKYPPFYNISPEGYEVYKENKKKLEKMLKEKRTKYTFHLIKF